VLEEFGPDLQHIKGKNNVVADALSCLDTDNNQEIFNVSECFGHDDDDLPPSSYPTRHDDIAKAQLINPASQTKLKNHKACNEITFRGGDKDHKLICHNGKTASLPPSLQQKTMDWHHEMLCHPGAVRTEAATCQHFDWKGPRITMVVATCKKCLNCQLAKPTNQKHSELPAKAAEENTWDTSCVNLIGPCKIERKGKQDLKLWCLTMINMATGWFEMHQIEQKCRQSCGHMQENMVHTTSTPAMNHPRSRHMIHGQK
jgi:hypothetical protein